MKNMGWFLPSNHPRLDHSSIETYGDLGRFGDLPF